ncbi:hypothetical protein ACFPPD_22335 [Cohnella suwonensis]|uniref:J domain-containing protein n=1 Tax=Cohnella suwonensis TaxID=696072 RepID=A0ABW0M2S1_9BACL
MDEELKKAYETLGLPADADREQVENRYFLLMKRARAAKSRTDAGGEGEEALDLTEINRAYNLVLGIETGKNVTVEKQTKVGHFFYYYKFHLIIGIIVVVLAAYFVKEGIDKRREAANTPPANLSVSLFGNFFLAEEDALSANLLKLVPDWQRIKSTVVYVPAEMKSPQDIALQQKSVLMLMTEKSELYITDEKNFESLAFQGAFVPLDEFLKKEPLDVPESKIRKTKSESDTDSRAYGIDITGNPAFNGIELGGEHTIVAIRAKEEKWDDSFKLLKPLVATTP